MEMLTLVSQLVSQRVLASLATVPHGLQGWYPIASITAATTLLGGAGAIATGFIQPVDDFKPPSVTSIWRPLSAFLVPGLLEEVIWRAALIPTPVAPTTVGTILQHATTAAHTISPPTLLLYRTAFAVLIVHVLAHPLCPAAIYPRGREVFGDSRFLFLALIVLGGTTLSYIVSGGSVWAAAFTHGLPVALWRDFFSGEEALQKGMKKRGYTANDEGLLAPKLIDSTEESSVASKDTTDTDTDEGMD